MSKRDLDRFIARIDRQRAECAANDAAIIDALPSMFDAIKAGGLQ